MYKKRLIMMLLCLVALTAIPQTARAATITSCTLDDDVYVQGQAGYISVTIYNDKSDKIKVTELSATINYYFEDGIVYLQKFFTNADLPDQIAEGQSETYQIPISLPNNIASGFTNPTVEATTELWSTGSEKWTSSDHPTYRTLKLYIESPYKQSYENSEKQYQEQVSVNSYLNNMMNLFAVTTVVFAAVAGILFAFFTKRARPLAQPQP